MKFIRQVNIYILFTYMLKSILIIEAVACFYWGHFMLGVGSFVIAIISSLPILMGKHFQVKIPAEFEFLAVVFIFAALFLGTVYDFYERFWWWDIVLHTSSGVILGIIGFLLVYVLNEKKDIELELNPRFIALFAFIFAVALGSFWEIFEYTMDQLFDLKMQETSLEDTMWDLIVDTLGALFMSLLGWTYLRNLGNVSFLEKWINNFLDKNPKLFTHSK